MDQTLHLDPMSDKGASLPQEIRQRVGRIRARFTRYYLVRQIDQTIGYVAVDQKHASLFYTNSGFFVINGWRVWQLRC